MKAALETITPPIFIGLIFATGVSAPVLPIWTSISNIFEIPLFAENLWAIAHLGAFGISIFFGFLNYQFHKPFHYIK